MTQLVGSLQQASSSTHSYGCCTVRLQQLGPTMKLGQFKIIYLRILYFNTSIKALLSNSVYICVYHKAIVQTSIISKVKLLCRDTAICIWLCIMKLRCTWEVCRALSQEFYITLVLLYSCSPNLSGAS